MRILVKIQVKLTNNYNKVTFFGQSLSFKNSVGLITETIKNQLSA